MIEDDHHPPRRRWLWRRGSDYSKAAAVAIVAALATNLTQCALSAGSDAARSDYWRTWSRGAMQHEMMLRQRLETLGAAGTRG